MADNDYIETLISKLLPHTNYRTPEGRSRAVAFVSDILTVPMVGESQSKAEQALQKLADAIYLKCFGKKCPYRMHYMIGYTDHLFQVSLLPKEFSGTADEWNTLCHELLHVADPDRPHGKRFETKVDEMVKLVKN